MNKKVSVGRVTRAQSAKTTDKNTLPTSKQSRIQAEIELKGQEQDKVVPKAKNPRKRSKRKSENNSPSTEESAIVEEKQVETEKTALVKKRKRDVSTDFTKSEESSANIDASVEQLSASSIQSKKNSIKIVKGVKKSNKKGDATTKIETNEPVVDDNAELHKPKEDNTPPVKNVIAKSESTVKNAPVSENDSMPAVLQLKIMLKNISPPIWRRIEVLTSDTFLDLSQHIIAAMGWNGCHLNQSLSKHDRIIIQEGNDELKSFSVYHTLKQSETKISRFLTKVGDRVLFEYDFGDNWKHIVAVEKILQPSPCNKYPRCVGGRRACPPEDCGGIVGYNHLCHVYKNPKHEEYQELIVEWLGEFNSGWNPEKFDKEQVF